MSPRTVGHLALDVVDPAHAGRARVLLEDALRTASLVSGPPGAVLCIREVALGDLRLDQPAQAWATRLEQRVRALAAGAVHASAPEAERAEAVWFASAAQQRALHVETVLHTGRASAWFWRGAAPVAPERAGVRAAVRASLDAPSPPAQTGHRLPEVVLAARVLEVWVHRGTAARVLAALDEPPAPVARWLPVPFEPVATAPAAPLAWRVVAEQVAATRGPHHPLVAWVALSAVLVARPELSAAPTRARAAAAAWRAQVLVGASGARAVASVGERPSTPALEAEATHPPPPAQRPDPAAAQAGPPALDASTGAPAPPAPRPTRPASPVPPPAVRPSSRPRPAPVDPRWAALGWPELDGVPRPTALGGTLFLVHALRRAGLDEAIEADPTLAGVGALALWAVLDRLDPDGLDPHRGVLPRPDEPDPRAPGWAEAAAARVAPWKPEAPDPIAWLVTRPGLLAATRTHADLILPLSAVELEVRRGALDADPGWVPWLGRVVTFHYVEDDAFARAVGEPA